MDTDCYGKNTWNEANMSRLSLSIQNEFTARAETARNENNIKHNRRCIEKPLQLLEITWTHIHFDQHITQEIIGIGMAILPNIYLHTKHAPFSFQYLIDQTSSKQYV